MKLFKKSMPNKLLLAVLSASLAAGSLPGPSLVRAETAAVQSGAAASAENAPFPPLPEAAEQLKDQLARLRDFVLPADLTVLKQAREKARGLKDPSLFAEIGFKILQAKAGKPGYEAVTPQALLELVQDLAFDYDPDLNDLAMVRAKHAALLDALVKLSGNPDGMKAIDYGDLYAFAQRYVYNLQAAVGNKNLNAILDRKTISALLNEALTRTLASSDLVVSQVVRGLKITADDLIKVKDRVSVIVDPSGSAKLALAVTVVRSRVEYKETADKYRKKVTPTLWLYGKQVPGNQITWEAVKNVPGVKVQPNGTVTLVSGKGAVVTVRAVLKSLNKPLVDSRTVYLGNASPDKPQLPPEAAYLVKRLTQVRDAIRPADLPAIRQARDRLAALTNPSLIREVWEPISKKKGKKTGFDQVTQKNLLAFIAGFGVPYDSDFSQLEQLRRDNAELLDQLAILGGEPKGMDAVSFADLTAFLVAYEQELKNGLLTGKGKTDAQKLLAILTGTYKEKAWNKVLADKKLKISAILRGLGIQGKDIDKVSTRIAWTVDPLYRARFDILLAYFKTQLNGTTAPAISPDSLKLETLLPALLQEGLKSK